jgi:hypothetical protein
VPPCGTWKLQPRGRRRVAAQVVGHGVRLHGAWPPLRWVCRSRAHPPCSGPAATSPQIRSTRILPSNARADGPAPTGRGHRCTSAPPFDDARPAEGGLVIWAAATSPACSGLPTVPGVAALLVWVHPSQHQLRLVPGALPPSSPTAFWSFRAAVVAASCGRSWCSCDAPRTLLQDLFANKRWLYMPLTLNRSVVRIAWVRPATWQPTGPAGHGGDRDAGWPPSTSTSWSPGCWRGLAVRWDRDDGRCFAFVLLAYAIVCFNQL